MSSDYRQHYREHEIGPRYSGIGHAAFNFGLGIVVVLWLAWSLQDVQALEWLTIPVTFVYANLVEYVGHRWPMHHPLMGLKDIYRRHAGQHHRFFTDQTMAYDTTRDFQAVLFPPILMAFFFGLFMIPLWFLIAWLIAPNVASLFSITGILYYLNYEALHLAYHHRPVRQLPVVRYLARLHTTHHDPTLMTRYNFNISYPIGDWLFGTFKAR